MNRRKRKIKSLSLRIIRNAMIPIFLVSVVSCVVCFFLISNNILLSISSGMDEQWKVEIEALDSAIEKPLRYMSETESQKTANKYFKSITDSTSKKSSIYYHDLREVLDNIKSHGRKYITSSWALAYNNGVYLTDSESDIARYHVSCLNEPWYIADKQDNSYYISLPYITTNPDSGEKTEVMSVVYPVYNGETDLSGYMGFDVPVSYLRQVLQDVNRDIADICLYSDDGDILYVSSKFTNNNSEKINELYNSEKNKKNKENQISTYRYEDGDIIVKSYSGLENGFFFILTVPRSLLLSTTFTMMIPIFIVFLVGFVIMFLSMLFVSRGLVNPMKRMIVNTKKVGDGELDMVLEIPTEDEMGQLVDVFNTTVVRMRHKAEHDPLTDVYNHDKFCQEAEEMLKNEEKKVVVIRLDVDQFKTVNELFDWEVGNRLLKYIAKVLTDNTPRDCIFGREGGDVFHICLYYEEFGEILSLLDDIKREICKFNEINLKIYPHFGICLCSNRDLSVHIICDHAGVALKQIKGNILETYAVYDDRLEERIMNRKFVEIQKEAAMINREFFVQMQPKTNMLTDKIVGAEALVRWKHPEKGIIRPDEFIPVFEKDGYILNLDEFVWEESCRYIAKWLQKGIEVPVSVNVSRMHIFDESFINKLTCLTEKYNIPKNLLELEFTESAMLDDVADLYRIMEELGGMGFPLVMDDFASGYSSLNMLKALDFDVVKLDKEFVDEVTENNKSYQLVAATIGMLHKLNVKIVGEGIETIGQVEKLKNAGLIIAQGYYYSKPLNIDSFEEKLYRNYDVLMEN